MQHEYGIVKVNPGVRLLFIGDSVTDCDRAHPIGAGSHAALGNGYVADVDTLLAESGDPRGIQVTNMGTSGNTVRDLSRRWETDVMALKPEWVSIMVGINDVWRQFDGKDDAAAVLPVEFRRIYDQLLSRTRPHVEGLIIMSPFYVQDLRADAMRRCMDEYTAITRELAATRGAIFVDVQAAFDGALARMGYASIAGDRVHPTPEGHRILARAFVDAVR
jgi:lysophospholipase L1-like esterase